MFGHALPLGAAAFWLGAGVGVFDVDGVLEGALAALVEVVLCVVVAAPAFAMPAAAPPVASAPATIVAPSSLEMDIGSNLLRSIGGVCSHRARPR
jgi:hypothetical protein